MATSTLSLTKSATQAARLGQEKRYKVIFLRAVTGEGAAETIEHTAGCLKKRPDFGFTATDPDAQNSAKFFSRFFHNAPYGMLPHAKNEGFGTTLTGLIKKGVHHGRNQVAAYVGSERLIKEALTAAALEPPTLEEGGAVLVDVGPKDEAGRMDNEWIILQTVPDLRPV